MNFLVIFIIRLKHTYSSGPMNFDKAPKYAAVSATGSEWETNH